MSESPTDKVVLFPKLSVCKTISLILAPNGSSTPTLEDILKKINEASAWLTTADDTCQPYCVDIELWNAPNCGVIEDELLIFEEFYYETVNHDLSEGTLNVSGRCNRQVAIARRVLASDIG
ncbi:hypothetical protein LCGC14_2963500 [marine sediment metagenome]|uniref:Uncharacterized protein n=1 Tax=marine sediment metagenome TaxID=412755 RepID=A0A0F8ZJB0_9ZZZZ